jgi:hypothetical protein
MMHLDLIYKSHINKKKDKCGICAQGKELENTFNPVEKTIIGINI